MVSGIGSFFEKAKKIGEVNNSINNPFFKENNGNNSSNGLNVEGFDLDNVVEKKSIREDSALFKAIEEFEKDDKFDDYFKGLEKMSNKNRERIFILNDVDSGEYFETINRVCESRLEFNDFSNRLIEKYELGVSNGELTEKDIDTYLNYYKEEKLKFIDYSLKTLLSGGVSEFSRGNTSYYDHMASIFSRLDQFRNEITNSNEFTIDEKITKLDEIYNEYMPRIEEYDYMMDKAMKMYSDMEM